MCEGIEFGKNWLVWPNATIGLFHLSLEEIMYIADGHTIKCNDNNEARKWQERILWHLTKCHDCKEIAATIKILKIAENCEMDSMKILDPKSINIKVKER